MNHSQSGRVALIVLDGVGIGAAPDAEEYGDAASNTLGNVARAVGGLDLPYLDALGLGCCRQLDGMSCSNPKAAHGIAVPESLGKDSITGHWELCGVILDRPFPVYPNGFPTEIVDRFAQVTGRGVLANRPASGTAVIEEYGVEHLETGAWILYTSADSVFQIAAHEELIPLDELYAGAQAAREILRGDHGVARVIARPFVGDPGSFHRMSEHRRDFSLEPTAPTLLDRLAGAGVQRIGVGKVDDLFAGRGIASRHTAVNEDAYTFIGNALHTMESGFLLANVIEFDQTWGHRNDIPGFYGGLAELDRRLPDLVGLLRDEDLMILTADHGNDPTGSSTDHSREAVPILVTGPRVRPAALGSRAFVDVGATVADYFGLEAEIGLSFLPEIYG